MWAAIGELSVKGYAHVRGSVLEQQSLSDRDLIDRAFHLSQAQDPGPGERWRSHSAFDLDGKSLRQRPAQAYRQTKDYNPDHGDLDRHFRPIAPAVLTSRTLQELVGFNLSVAEVVMPDLIRSGPKVDIHMVAYRPFGDVLAYSSPSWLHRDQEQYVAVVLCGLSPNLGGGENLLAYGKDYHGVVKLREPMDMLLLTQRPTHAVYPMYSDGGRPAWRNIMLITFSKT